MGRLNDGPGYFVPIMKLGDSKEVESLTQKLLGPSFQLSGKYLRVQYLTVVNL